MFFYVVLQTVYSKQQQECYKHYSTKRLTDTNNHPAENRSTEPGKHYLSPIFYFVTEPRAKCWLSDFTMMSSAWWAFLISALQRKRYGLLHPEPFGDFYTAFRLWCWRKLLRVPWTARRSNQSIWKENNPEYSLVGLMLKLNLQCFGHLMQRANSLEKTLMLGKIEGRRRRGRQRVRWLDGISDSMDMSLSQLWEIAKDRRLVCFSPWGHKESDTTEWLNNMPLIFQCLNSKRKSASLYSYRNRNAMFYYLYQNQLPNYSDIGTNVLTHCLSICSSRAESETGACMPGILIPRSRSQREVNQGMRESQYKTASSRCATAATYKTQTNRASDELMKWCLEIEENIDLWTFAPPAPYASHWFKVMHGC